MKKYRPEQIVEKLRQADRELGKGLSVKDVCRRIEISEQTYYRWRLDYNHHRPHSMLNWMTPAAFAVLRKTMRPHAITQGRIKLPD